MKKIITFLLYFGAVFSLTYMMLTLQQVTNKHLLIAIFDAVVIFTISIQKDRERE